MLKLTTGQLRIMGAVLFLYGGIACATTDDVSQRGGGDEEGGTSSSSSGGSSESGGSSSSSGGSSSASGGSTTTASGGAAKGGTAATGSGGSTTTASGGAAKGGTTGAGGAVVVSMGGAVTSGPPGTQLFLDDFEDGDYTAPPAQQWLLADTNGTYSVATQGTSKALTVVGSSKTGAVSGDIGWTDQMVTAKVNIVAGTSTVAYLMGRWAAIKSYVVLEYRVGTTSSPKGDMKLRVNLDGSTTDICRFKPTSALPSEWHTVGFSIKGGSGSTMNIYFDGTAVTADVPCVLPADAPTAGGISVGVQSGTAAFDDVTVVVP
ncbi:MAG: hypothetical protein QM756_08080 [Polyangiaceae bacterium]